MPKNLDQSIDMALVFPQRQEKGNTFVEPKLAKKPDPLKDWKSKSSCPTRGNKKKGFPLMACDTALINHTLPVSAQGHTAPNKRTAEPRPTGITGNWTGGMQAKNRIDTGSHVRSVSGGSVVPLAMTAIDRTGVL